MLISPEITRVLQRTHNVRQFPLNISSVRDALYDAMGGSSFMLRKVMGRQNARPLYDYSRYSFDS
jgi:hypothetical protein